jgi:hypothetical protein
MKKFYTLTLVLSSLFFFSNPAGAQNYTAVRNGNWDNAAGPWDPNGKPPSSCSACTITINSGVTVTLNTSIKLLDNTQLVIGTNSALGNALLSIPASAGTGFASANNVLLDNTGNTGTSKIVLLDGSSAIAVASDAGPYDGVLTSNSGFLKLVGPAPGLFFADGTVQSPVSGIYGNTLAGSIIVTAPGPLPILLSEFTAVLTDDAVGLSWTTGMEVNSDRFEVERSADAGAHWEVLGTVAARGISSLPVNYSFSDPSPVAGTGEYRLRMIDLDGKYVFSEVRTVRSGLISALNVYPNPAKDFVNITLGGAASASLSIRLINQAGQLLVEKKVDHAGGTTISLPVGSYPQGNYLILVAGADGVQQVSKLLISKN